MEITFNQEITPVHEDLLTGHEKDRLANIRFDCIVRMSDYGCRTYGGGFLTPEKHTPPQWFRCELRFTLEGIKHGDPFTIGMALQKAYFDLEQKINEYTAK